MRTRSARPSASLRIADRRPAPSAWRVITVELDDPLEDVPMAGADTLHVTAFSGGRPVGIVVVPAPLDPFPAGLLAEVLRDRFGWVLHHARLTRSIAGPALRATPAPSATVVVCTRDRPTDLARCLASIARLAPPVADVLVVDNGSTGPETRQVAEAAGARYVAEPLPGLDRARNRAIAETSTDVLLYTDDDVEVDARWAERLLACFADPLVMAATGLVLPARLDSPARRRFERYAGFSRRGVRRTVFDGTKSSPLRAGRAGAGASMAFRTTFLRGIRGFPEELDAGMPTGSGGDSYALYRVMRAGFRVVYEPASVAFHHHRDTEAGLRRALRGYGSGTYSYFAHAAVHDRDPAAVAAAVRAAFQYTGHAMVAALLRRPGSVPLALAAAEARGALDTPAGYRAARRMVRARPPVLGADTVPTASSAMLDAIVHRSTSTPAGAPDAPGSEPLPSISVVIPSRGRRDSVVKLLRRLDVARYPDDRVQVVVCIDGDVDGSAAAIRAAGLRRPVDVVVLDAPPGPPGGPGNGAGVARNRGAAVATGDVLLFLDDDVDPVGDGVLLAHGRAQAAGLAVCVGPCPPEQWDEADTYARHVRTWWVDHTMRLVSGAPLTFTDVCTGNVSMPRARFVELGGFADIPRREDWELGYRLLDAGVPLRAAPDAVVLHHADMDLRNALDDRRSEGAGDYAFAEAHPQVAALLPLGAWPELSGRWRQGSTLMLTDRRALAPMLAVAVPWLGILGRLGLVGRWVRLLGRLQFLAYWAGVADAAGGERQVAATLAAGATAAGGAPLLDLQGDGWVPPVAGAASELTVIDARQALGTAPLRWGGLPWDREKFAGAVADWFVDSSIRARARSKARAS